MKKTLFLAFAATCLTAGTSLAQTATFASGQGWVDGDVKPATQGDQTSSIAWAGTQGENVYNVDSSGSGLLSVVSQNFLRSTFSLEGTAMTFGPAGSTLQLDFFGISLGGGYTFSSNRILAELSLTSTTSPTTPNTASNYGVQLRSSGTNWHLDGAGFGSEENIDTGISVGSAIDVSLLYTAVDATNVSLTATVGGSTATLMSTISGGALNSGSLYGWTNSSQGPNSNTGGLLQFDGVGITQVNVPEPTTALMLLGGGGMLALLRRRR